MDNEDFYLPDSGHDRLLGAVSRLDKTQYITEPTRNEPTNLNSEFNLVKKSKEMKIGNLLEALEDTAHHVKLGKKIKKTHSLNKVLPLGLGKIQAERVRRSTGYEETKKRVGRWDPVVARSRTIDSVSFPLKSTTVKNHPTEEFLTKLTLKSSLEKELEQVSPPPVEEDTVEEKQVYPMTYQEMVEQRKHIAKLRAQESYNAAKAKRQSKIKSKKYHRILKKEKLKQQLKEFEELQKNNPEEALKKLEALEKARALERHTLRHKNTGKWAKSKLVRAKYDKEVRQQLTEQLSVSRALTSKIQAQESTDDDDVIDNETLPDISLSQDPMNPWMLKSGDKHITNEEFDFGYKKNLRDKIFKPHCLDDSDSDNDSCTENLVSKLNSNNIMETLNNEHKNSKEINKNEEVISTTTWHVLNEGNAKNENTIRQDISVVFDSYESKVVKLVDKKLNKLRKNIKKIEKSSTKLKVKSMKKGNPYDNLEYLKFKNQRKKPIINEKLTETTSKYINTKNDDDNHPKTQFQSPENTEDIPDIDPNRPENTEDIPDIDPNRFIKIQPKFLNTSLSDDVNKIDDLEDKEQIIPKITIEEVFEDDDVVASFRQEKEDEINKDKPSDTELSLPGWGCWGGKGIKVPKCKNSRIIFKPPPKYYRRDENKGDVIIKEYKDPKLSVHKVTDVPFPFSSVKEYEASIRLPIGNTFIPENAHKLLIRPNVITRAGTIIEAMDEDQLLVKRNRIFNNEAIIKLLGQK